MQKAEPKTFRAREVDGGLPVYLHLLAGMDAVSRASLVEKARALAAAGNPDILDVDDNEFSPYVVTPVLDDFDSLPTWLARLPQRSSLPAVPDGPPTETITIEPVSPLKPAAPAEPVAATPPGGGGDFTGIFGGAGLGVSPSPAAPAMPAAAMPPAATPFVPLPPVPSVSPMPLSAAPLAEPGEFTRLFGGTGLTSPPNPRPVPAPAPPGKPLSVSAAAPFAPLPGEFTQIFGGSLTPPAPPPERLDAPSATGGSEFTRLFGTPPAAPGDQPVGFSSTPPLRQRAPEAPLPWEPQSSPPAPVVPPRPAPPAVTANAGESMWNSQAQASQGRNVAPVSGPGEFTRFFESPMAAGSLPIEEIEQGRMPEARVSADRPFEGPGEFTRLFGKSVPAEAAPPPSPPAQHPTFSGRATGLFDRPDLSAAPPASSEPRGPSQYTGMMAAPRVEEPAVYVPAQKPGNGPLIMVILIVVVVLMLAAVAFVLTVRHH